MRFKSKKVDGYQVFAVSGTNTVSFGIDFDSTKTKGLLGFGVTRKDPGKEKPYDMYGFKVFPSIVPKPDEKTSVRTSQHPIQSFVWDDFTAQPDETYEYAFHPLKGTPKNLDRRASPIPIKVRTEKLFSNLEHDIFFNRGVASSQAYVRKFGNKKPDQLSPAKRKEAEEWLSRKLDDAMLVFIKAAKKGDTLLCCFYEFRYEPAAQELKNALSRGVKLRLIVDAKVNKRKDKKTGKMIESFPREENLRMLKEVSMPSSVVILRQNKPSNIQHNKFMVLLKGRSSVPTEVWTGSTNLSVGGIHGQTNVGHWVRNKKIAVQFRDYWNLLSADPGPKKGDDRATALKKNNAWRSSVEKKLDKAPTSLKSVPKGVTTIFSPRSGMAVLNMYAQMVDDGRRFLYHARIRHQRGVQKAPI